MAQINKGDTFVDGQSVTGSRLNALVDSATLAVGAITDQTNVTAGSLVSADSTIVAVSGVLKEATMGDINGSNIPVVTSSVTAGTSSDIVITPNDSTVVSGIPYVSADGLTVVATTPTAHGLTVGQVLLISAAGTGYNGTFRITAVQTFSPYTFTYVMTTAATAGSGSFSYTKKGTIKNTGNKVISGNLYVDGNAVITGTTNLTGIVNVTGDIQYNGTPVYGLYATETSLPYTPNLFVTTYITFSSTWYLGGGTDFFSDTITVPANEIWDINYNYYFRTELSSLSPTWGAIYILDGVGTPFALGFNILSTSGVISFSAGNPLVSNNSNPVSMPAIFTLTAGTHTIKLRVAQFGSGVSQISNTLGCNCRVIKKYKTA